jgi:two-component system response regulator HydG
MVIKEVLPSDSDTDKSKGTNTSLFIAGHSSASKQLHEFIQLVAPTDMSVIVQGESGTGKEYVARTIHQQSKRAEAPFVAVDCGAISGEIANSELFGHVKGAFTGATHDKQGLFETAHGGTIFLDEVGNLSYDIQVKLLRALQERIIQP